MSTTIAKSDIPTYKIYTFIAAKMFNIPPELVTPEQYQVVKQETYKHIYTQPSFSDPMPNQIIFGTVLIK